jgi:hypothetical protein
VSGNNCAVRVELDYTVPPGELVDVLTDPEFLAARNAHFRGRGDPTVERSGTSIVVTVPRQVPLEHVPRPFLRLVGGGAVVETATWVVDGSAARATWSVNPGPAPIDLGGSHEIGPTAAGCRHVVTAEIWVRVPIGRRQLTHLVATHLADLVRAEQSYAARWLTGDRI